MCVLQSSDMGSYALYQRWDSAKSDVISTLKDTNQTAFTKLVGYFLKIFCEPLVIEFINACITTSMDLVVLMCIKACWAEDKVRLELHESVKNLLRELLSPIWCRGITRFYRYVEDASRIKLMVILSCVLLNSTCAWIEDALELLALWEVRVAFTAFIVLEIIEEVHWSEQHIFAVVIV